MGGCFIGGYLAFESSRAVAQGADPRNLTLADFENRSLDEDKLFLKVQEWREANHKEMYKLDGNLCRLAAVRAVEVRKDWSHDGFLKEGKLMMVSGYQSLGENLARDMRNEDEALTAWLNSPTHKKNLDADFTHSCIVCVDNNCAHEFASF